MSGDGAILLGVVGGRGAYPPNKMGPCQEGGREVK